VQMQLTRAIILEELGRSAEAKAARKLAAATVSPYPMTPYEVFHERLKELRLNHRTFYQQRKHCLRAIWMTTEVYCTACPYT
jgi:hypothetical protein